MEVLVNLESNKQYPTLVQHGAETHIPIQVMSVIALLDFHPRIKAKHFHQNMSCRITRLCKNRNYFRENNNQTRFCPINRNPGLGRKARDSFTTKVRITPAGANRRRSRRRKPSVRGRISR